MRHYILLVALAALTACGTRGSLTMPPGPAPAPLFGNPAPKPAQKPAKPAQEQESAPAEPSAGGDLNTATEAAK